MDEEQETTPLTKEEMQFILKYMRLMEANIENWKYVLVNAEHLEKKVVTGALEQVLEAHEPTFKILHRFMEFHSISFLEPEDFL